MGNKKIYAVYGSLRKGFGNHRLLENKEGVKYLKQEVVKGFKLYSLGWFPGVKPTNNPNSSVLVELYEIENDDVKVSLDRLEGYDPHNPQNSLYIRETIPTSVGDTEIYIYNNNINEEYLIDEGDWAAFRELNN